MKLNISLLRFLASWTLLGFGGYHHCVDKNGARDGPVACELDTQVAAVLVHVANSESAACAVCVQKCT